MADSVNSSQITTRNLIELIPSYLPHSDGKGNYWLGKDCNGPAILSSCVRPGTWFASMGSLGSVLFKGRYILYFSTPERALHAMREWVKNNAS